MYPKITEVKLKCALSTFGSKNYLQKTSALWNFCRSHINALTPQVELNALCLAHAEDNARKRKQKKVLFKIKANVSQK